MYEHLAVPTYQICLYKPDKPELPLSVISQFPLTHYDVTTVSTPIHRFLCRSSKPRLTSLVHIWLFSTCKPTLATSLSVSTRLLLHSRLCEYTLYIHMQGCKKPFMVLPRSVLTPVRGVPRSSNKPVLSSQSSHLPVTAVTTKLNYNMASLLHM